MDSSKLLHNLRATIQTLIQQMYNTFIIFIKLLFNLHVREYYSDVKIATLSQVSLTMSLKKRNLRENCNICKQTSPVSCKAEEHSEK